jgi:hypothetical protein
MIMAVQSNATCKFPASLLTSNAIVPFIPFNAHTAVLQRGHKLSQGLAIFPFLKGNLLRAPQVVLALPASTDNTATAFADKA